MRLPTTISNGKVGRCHGWLLTTMRAGRYAATETSAIFGLLGNASAAGIHGLEALGPDLPIKIAIHRDGRRAHNFHGAGALYLQCYEALRTCRRH
jgi:hypothetical protein